MREPPWQPRTRQQEGDQTEKKVIKQRGGRSHPRSGAGKIRYDGSTSEDLIEVKDSHESITIRGSYLLSLFKEATRQGKNAVFVIRFRKANVILECVVRRYDPTKDG